MEDLETPMPCAFTDLLNHMSKPYEEMLLEYKNLFDAHIDPAFRANSNIEELLLSPKGLQVFVPKEWTGIKCTPIKIRWREDVPTYLKPKARSINPRLYDNALQEFKRHSGYMYIPSQSPVASPLVIAPKATAPFIRFCGDYVQIGKYIITNTKCQAISYGNDGILHLSGS